MPCSCAWSPRWTTTKQPPAWALPSATLELEPQAHRDGDRKDRKAGDGRRGGPVVDPKLLLGPAGVEGRVGPDGGVRRRDRATPSTRPSHRAPGSCSTARPSTRATPVRGIPATRAPLDLTTATGARPARGRLRRDCRSTAPR